MEYNEIKELVKITGGIIGTDRFIDNQDKLVIAGQVSKEVAYDNIVKYNEMLGVKPKIEMFIGEEAIFTNYEHIKLDGKLIFKSTDSSGKLHMFTYDLQGKMFFGRETLRYMADMGILTK